jgi:hypothetical protein
MEASFSCAVKYFRSKELALPAHPPSSAESAGDKCSQVPPAADTGLINIDRAHRQIHLIPFSRVYCEMNEDRLGRFGPGSQSFRNEHPRSPITCRSYHPGGSKSASTICRLLPVETTCICRRHSTFSSAVLPSIAWPAQRLGHMFRGALLGASWYGLVSSYWSGVVRLIRSIRPSQDAFSACFSSALICR